MKNTITFTALICLFLIIGCKKKCEQKEVLYTVLEKTKKEIPYTGFDTLTFVRTSVGDTHVFIGLGKTLDYKFSRAAADCSNTNKEENYFFTYVSKTISNKIIVGYNSPNSLSYHHLEFKNQKFEGDLFFYTPIPLIDSLNVLGKIYYNVQAMPNDDPLNSPFVAFFDEIVGCIKIRLINGETWELLSIKN
jgi:hypothetical protein